jgi:hypothetical protein
LGEAAQGAGRQLRAFDRFIGIDWSGAAGEYQRGIQVAAVDAGTNRLELVRPPVGSCWSRQSVLDFITRATDQRTLVGLDFAFSLPWNRDLEALPVCFNGLEGARQLWAFVDDFCSDMPFLHASAIWKSQDSPFRPFIKFWSRATRYQGDLFNGGQLRKTEIAAQASGLRPKSVYRLAGHQVGAGSFAGMRLLNRIARVQSTAIAIWPFDETEKANVVIAEIYPSAFYRLTDQSRPTPRLVKSGAHAATVVDVLKFFYACYDGPVRSSVDAIDALVSAVAMMHLSQNPALLPSFDDPDISGNEGWIFGVRHGDGP